MDLTNEVHVLQKLLGHPKQKAESAIDVNYQARLLSMIEDFLADKMSFDEFEAQFSDCYLEEMPEDGLTDEGHDFFGGVHEKFSWTGLDPAEKDRRYGWISREEFVEWLRARRATYGSGPSPR